MVTKALAMDLLLLGALFLLGILQTRIVCSYLPPLETFSLSFPLGLGTITWFLFLLSWFGVHISVISITILYIVLLLCLVLIRRFYQSTHKDIAKRSSILQNPPGIVSAILWGFLIFLFLSAIFLSVGRSYSTWDAIAVWSVKGYGIALEGDIFAGRTWGSLELKYPLNLPLVISIFKLFSDDILPGSKLVFPILSMSLLVNVYSFLTRREIDKTHAMFGTLLLASVPLLFVHATIGYANLALTLYIVLGVLYAMEGIFEIRQGALILSGFLLGFATWTRQEGLLLSLLVVFTLSMTWLISRKGKLKIVPLLIPLAIIGIAWVIFFRINETEGLITRAFNGALLGISQGQFHLDSLYQIFRYAARQILEPSIWGLLFPASLVLIILAGPQRFVPQENIYLFGGGVVASVIGMAVLIFYFSVSYDHRPLEWWLTTSFNRMILPVGVLTGILAVMAIGSSSLLRNDHE